MAARIVDLMTPPRGSSTYRNRIREAVEVLGAGAVVALPTDTVWGLACLARHTAMVERIHALKGRAAGTPTACLIGDPAWARENSTDWGPAVQDLVQRYWPGPLTLVLPTRNILFPALQARGPNLGVRMPEGAVLLDILGALGEPLAATSANRSGEPEVVDEAGIGQVFPEGVDMILRTGQHPQGRGSAVVELSADGPRVLREGPIPIRSSRIEPR